MSDEYDIFNMYGVTKESLEKFEKSVITSSGPTEREFGKNTRYCLNELIEDRGMDYAGLVVTNCHIRRLITQNKDEKNKMHMVNHGAALMTLLTKSAEKKLGVNLDEVEIVCDSSILYSAFLYDKKDKK